MAHPTRFIATLLILALAVCAAANAADEELQIGKLIDLTGDLETDLRHDTWLDRRAADLYDCRFEELSGGALVGAVRIGAVILTRDRATADPTSKIFRQADDAILLDAGQLELGTAAGLDITLLIPFGRAVELETRYFNDNGWHATHTASAPGGVRFEGFGTVLSAEAERTNYRSRLMSFELNLRPRVAEGFPVIIGFRTFQLHERFEVWQVEPAAADALLANRSNNYLWGVQVGAEPYLMGGDGAFRLEGAIKGGIYANHAHQSTFSPLLDTAVSARHDRACFAGGVGLTLDWRFSRFFAARVGYELLWIQGVALAPNQSLVTHLPDGAALLNLGATSFYQGATANLEFVF